MNYLSVCSGIEAASVAWEPLGWKPVAFAEIEPFPSAVLAYGIKGTAIGRKPENGGNGLGVSCEISDTLTTVDKHAVAFAENSRAELRLEGGDGQRTGAVSTGGGKPGQGTPMIAQEMRVRRLTPIETERLQGFPDNHTAIPWRGKPSDECPDGPRYKACGNSMAVPVIRWIGQRIAKVESLPAKTRP